MTVDDDAAALGLAAVGDAAPHLVALLRDLVRTDGEIAPDLTVPASGDEMVNAMAMLVPEARERQRRAGVPDEVIDATLRDVGRKHRLYGAETVLPWLVGILRGDVVEVGRLQVERRPSAHGHALHIPETGALSPALVDESLERAAALTGATAFSCTSWLLDPRIRAELPGSNIASFAARFDALDPGHASASASASVAKFVFRRSVADVLDPAVVVPQSRLERLVANTLRAGEDWTEPVGLLARS
jgi:hypothetical protein